MTDLSAFDEMSRRGFSKPFGYEFVSIEVGEISARIPVGEHLYQPFGLVHGGVYASIAETLASVGTYHGVEAEGKVGLGMSNHTTFLRSMTEGTIHASANAIHKGRTTWIWNVEMRDDKGQLCAVSVMTIAVRERRP